MAAPRTRARTERGRWQRKEGEQAFRKARDLPERAMRDIAERGMRRKARAGKARWTANGPLSKGMIVLPRDCPAKQDSRSFAGRRGLRRCKRIRPDGENPPAPRLRRLPRAWIAHERLKQEVRPDGTVDITIFGTAQRGYACVPSRAHVAACSAVRPAAPMTGCCQLASRARARVSARARAYVRVAVAPFAFPTCAACAAPPACAARGGPPGNPLWGNSPRLQSARGR